MGVAHSPYQYGMAIHQAANSVSGWKRHRAKRFCSNERAASACACKPNNDPINMSALRGQLQRSSQLISNVMHGQSHTGILVSTRVMRILLRARKPLPAESTASFVCGEKAG